MTALVLPVAKWCAAYWAWPKVAEIAGIEDPQTRAKAEVAALRMAKRLLLQRHEVSSMAQVLDWVRA